MKQRLTKWQENSLLTRRHNWFSLFNARLSRRIVFWVFLSIIIIEAIILVPSVEKRKEELYSQLKALSEAKINSLAQTDPQASAQEILNQLRSLEQINPTILGGTIYDNNGQIIGSFGIKNTVSLAEIKTNNPNNYIITKSQLKAFFTLKITNQNYLLIICHDTSKVRQELIGYIFRIAGLVLIISAFVTCATLLVLEPTIITPILQLRKDLIAAGEAVRNNQQPPKFLSLSYHAENELKDVIEAFNIMYQQVTEAITERRQAECQMAKLNVELEKRVRERTEELRYNAYHDRLTGLPNRALLLEKLVNAFTDDDLFAVIFLDVDRFSVINNSFGHSFGDKLLTAIAQRLQQSLSENQLVARLGGDEFAIFLANINNLQDAVDVAQYLRQQFIQPFQINQQEIFTSISLGIAMSSRGYDCPEAILRDADLVMYRAKNSGRGRYEIFDQAMHQQLLAQHQLETDLRREVNNLNNSEASGFYLNYQPIINLQTNKIIGFEALVRWLHPEKGIISPAHFIPKAEETGLIIPLGAWILETACSQVRTWEAELPHLERLQISVNLSSRQFVEADLPRKVEEILANTGLNGSQLKLEITESTLIDNTDLIREMLLAFKEQKIKLSLDDFGTGYSSLSYLNRFPFDTLKVDQSFVREMEKNQQIIQTIVTLAHSLNMDVVAEGVETQAHLNILKSLQCEFGQGYFFSRPLDSLAAGKLLVNQV